MKRWGWRSFENDPVRKILLFYVLSNADFLKMLWNNSQAANINTACLVGFHISLDYFLKKSSYPLKGKHLKGRRKTYFGHDVPKQITSTEINTK